MCSRPGIVPSSLSHTAEKDVSTVLCKTPTYISHQKQGRIVTGERPAPCRNQRYSARRSTAPSWPARLANIRCPPDTPRTFLGRIVAICSVRVISMCSETLAVRSSTLQHGMLYELQIRTRSRSTKTIPSACRPGEYSMRRKLPAEGRRAREPAARGDCVLLTPGSERSCSSPHAGRKSGANHRSAGLAKGAGRGREICDRVVRSPARIKLQHKCSRYPHNGADLRDVPARRRGPGRARPRNGSSCSARQMGADATRASARWTPGTCPNRAGRLLARPGSAAPSPAARRTLPRHARI